MPASRTTNIRAMRRVQFHLIEDYLLMGWFAPPPRGFHYQHLYGIDMLWICDCAIPDLKKENSRGIDH